MALQPNFRRLIDRFAAGGRRWLAAAADVLFPHSCRGCGALLGEAAVLCRDCAAALPWIGGACRRCGMPVLVPGEEAACAECRGRRLGFDRAAAAGLHEGPLRRLVLIHKYAGDRSVLDFLAAALERCWREQLEEAARGPESQPGLPPPAVVPVPGHPLKTLRRGRDPVAELAREFSRRAGLTLAPVLRRSRWTASQTSLPRELRLRNPRDSFAARRRAAAPLRALLIDDVITTGATASDAARALRAAGAREVYVLAVARSPS